MRVSQRVAIPLLCACVRTAHTKDVHTLSLPKFLKGFWNVDIHAAAAGSGRGRIRGHLEFEQDPSDPNGMVSDFFEYPSDSSRRQIRDSDGETERETDERTSSEGGIYIGKVQLKLVSPTSGLLLYTAKDESDAEQMFEFEFDPNSNMLHTAHGKILAGGRNRNLAAVHSTIVAANHFQLITVSTDESEPKISSLSAKKGIPTSKQDSLVTRWGPSVLVLVFFIGSKFLRKKYGKGSDFMKERQGMPPKARVFPPPSGGKGKDE